MTAIVRTGNALEHRVWIVDARSFVITEPKPPLQKRPASPPSELLRGKRLTEAILTSLYGRRVKKLITLWTSKRGSRNSAILRAVLRIECLDGGHILVIGGGLVNRLAKRTVSWSRRRIQRACIRCSLGKSRVGIYRNRRVCVQGIRTEKAENASVKVAGATLCDYVYSAAQLATKLRIRRVIHDTKLLNGIVHLKRNRLVVAGRNIIHSIEQEVVGGRMLPGDAETRPCQC